MKHIKKFNEETDIRYDFTETDKELLDRSNLIVERSKCLQTLTISLVSIFADLEIKIEDYLLNTEDEEQDWMLTLKYETLDKYSDYEKEIKDRLSNINPDHLHNRKYKVEVNLRSLYITIV